MSDGETALQKVANCVPQVYFDIIGRVIPGTLIMGSIWIAVHGPCKFWISLKSYLDTSSVSSVTVSTVLVLLTSYTLAILIWCVLSCLITTICKIFDEPKSGIMKKLCDKIYWDNKDFHEKYEKLKYYDISAGNRVTKLKAQIHMAETLFIGLPLSCLVGIITYMIEVLSYFWSFSELKVEMSSLLPRFVSWALMLSAAICSLFARQYFIDHMNHSLDNNPELIRRKEKHSDQNEDKSGKNGDKE